MNRDDLVTLLENATSSVSSDEAGMDDIERAVETEMMPAIVEFVATYLQDRGATAVAAWWRKEMSR